MKKIYLTTLAITLLSVLGFAQNRSVTLGKAEIPVNLNSYNTLTISSWVKPAGNSGWSAVYSNDNGGYDIALHAYNGKWRVFHNRLIETNVPYNVGEWYHTATVYSPTFTKLYINGQLVYTGAGSSVRSGSTTTGVGSSYGIYPVYTFSGEMDDLRFWSYERTQEQINASRFYQLNGDDAGLIAYYTFDSDSFEDETANGNDAISSEGLTYNESTVGIFPYANRSVTLGKAEIPVNLNNYNVLTISSWVKPASNSGWSAVYSNDNGGYDLALHAYNGKWRVFHNRLIETNVPYNVGEWYHTATVYTLTSTKLYINGQLVYTGAGSSVRSGSTTTGVGSSYGIYPVYTFNGEMDDLRFWSYERTQEQIDTTRFKQLNGTESGLIAYYSFNFDSFQDETGNGNDAISSSGLIYNESTVALFPPSLVSGSCYKALSFDGDNDYIQLANPLSIGANSSTIELRVKIPLAGTQGLGATERVGNILGNYNSSPNSNWEIHDDGQLRIFWNGGQINSYGTIDLRDNQWHHLAFVRNVTNNTYKAYVDGVLDINLNTAGSDINFSSIHRIGGDNRSASGGPSFHGAMDEFRIWNVAKTQNEVSSLGSVEMLGTESGLKHYYNFDENQGTVSTDLAGFNDGNLVNMNSLAWESTPCATNSCNTVLNFEGYNDLVQLSNPLAIGNSSNTVELRVKVPVKGTNGLGSTERVGVILGNYNGSPNTNWEVHANGQLRIYWNGGEINKLGTIDLRDNQWHHIAFVRNTADNTFKAYVDGVLDINHSTAGTGITFSSTHRIGGDNRSAGGGPNFHGAMDEFRIWNVAKTQSELNALSSTTLVGTELGLVHYYNFDEGQGTNLNDLAGTNNGVLTYMSPTTDWTLANGNASCNAASNRMKNPEIATDEMEQEASQLSIYPNPTRGNFTLDFGNTTTSSIITITDYTGKLISSNSYSELQKVTLELNQPAGIYLVRIETDGKVQTKKIIKQ